MPGKREEILKQIVVENRRSWHVENDADGNLEFFFDRVVSPLRELRDEGAIDELFEAHLFARGRRFVSRVIIRGTVAGDVRPLFTRT